MIVLTVQRLLGPRPRSYGIRVGLLGLMLVLTVYSGMIVAPRIDTLQKDVAGPMTALAADDARRVRLRSAARPLDDARDGDARRWARAGRVGNA